MALGREVGIPVRYLQQAMLEERTRIGSAWPGGAAGSSGGAGAGDRPAGGGGEAELWSAADPLDGDERAALRTAGRSPVGSPGNRSAAYRPPFADRPRPSAPAIDRSCCPGPTTVSAAILPLETGRFPCDAARPMRAEESGATTSEAARRWPHPGAGIGTAIMVALGAMLPLVALLPFPVALGLGYTRGAAHTGGRADPARAGASARLLEQGAAQPQYRLPERAAGILGMLADEVGRRSKS